MSNKDLERLQSFPPFAERAECQKYGTAFLRPGVMQVNIGRRCNLVCKHCHLESGPHRTEEMSREVMESCLSFFRRGSFKTLDITGGAPEMNPHFQWFVKEAVRHAARTMVRSNLTILNEEGYSHLPDFYAASGVEIVASLPYYTERDTDRQRGKGVFSACLSVLRRLNALGYGSRPELVLNLVYNPGGAFLPPDQEIFAEEFRKKLLDSCGVTFNSLYTITNNPLGRFGDFLERSGNLTGYMNRLISAFNGRSVPHIMCRSQISVDWDGSIYDCDFNLALGLKANFPGPVQDLKDFSLGERKIVFANHCYACTAGAGSSCGGAIVN
ncbi:MAG: arsenosugar biosynthesis radical SAM protein ArsS [Synergistaceae bacterium]|jgi:radical SAM/Cys-rich protein|nr:arsenosugar biosynthesis radical SAM protein ArsS [Synergistaceae bacterium]